MENFIQYLKFLANGKVLSKGSNILGRDFLNNKHKKVFDYVIFNKDNDKKRDDVVIFEVSAGKDYVLALDKNYQVWAWGSNAKKQIDSNSNIIEFVKPNKIAYIVIIY